MTFAASPETLATWGNCLSIILNLDIANPITLLTCDFSLFVMRFIPSKLSAISSHFFFENEKYFTAGHGGKQRNKRNG